MVDNAANVHIINYKSLFNKSELNPCTTHGVATIGGSSLSPKGKGDAAILIQDDEGVSTEITLQDALYFPDSPVNIISIACLADTYNDDNGTSIKTSRYHSEFC